MTLLLGVLSLYLFIAVVATIYLVVFAISKGRTRLIAIFAILGSAVSIYLFGYLMELNSARLEQMMFWNLTQYFGLPFISSLWLLLALVYSRRLGKTSPAVTLSLFIIPAITFLIRLTNQYHHLFYSAYNVNNIEGFLVLHLTKGPWYWVNMSYVTLCLATATLIYFQRYINSTSRNRKGYGLLLLSSLLPYIGQILIAVDLAGWGIDYAALIFPLSLLGIYFAFSKYDIMSIKSLARDSIFENNRDAMALFDEGNRLIDCNHSARRLFNRLNRPEYNMPADAVFSERPLLLELFSRKTPVDMEFPVDGRAVHYEAGLTEFMDSDGMAIARMIVLRDVTARKQYEQSLRDSEEKLRLQVEHHRMLLDNIRTQVWYLSDEQTYGTVNHAHAAFLGKPAAELAHQNIYALLPKDVANICRKNNREVFSTGKSLASEEWTPDGNGEMRLLSVLKSPKLREDGSVEYLVCSAEDITERKRAEEERNRLIAAIEQAGEIVMIADPDGNIQYVNPAFENVTGYSRADVVGRNPRLLKSGRQDNDFYRNLWGTITSGGTWKGRMVNKRKDGSLYTEEAAISPVHDADGRIVNFVAVKRDITEHIRLTEQLQQAQRLESIGRLAGGIAHDFNNILTGISGFTRFALDVAPQDSAMRADLEEVVKLAKRAEDLTRQLLAFSRRQPLQTVVININRLIADLSKMLERLIGEDITLNIIPANDLGNVEADPGQIEQVIVNLTLNARDAMPGGGTLKIETSNVTLDDNYSRRRQGAAPGDYVMLAITDTGEGMDEEVRRRLFEPFFTTKRQGEGTGLGLAMVYGIVKQHGGNIWVYSEKGMGSTFKIYLPRVEESAPTAPPSEHETLAGGNETILVLEDEAGVREVITRMLEQCGYCVLGAGAPSEADIILDEYGSKIALLLTDVVLPERNGRQMFESARKRHTHLRALYMSGYTDNTIVHHGVLDSDAQFIQKPFTLESLARKVREALDAKE